MVVKKTKGERFYRVGNKYRVHGYNDKGRYGILRWEDIAEDLREFDFQEDDDGEKRFRILEWVLHFIPTRGDNRPSSYRNWEVRILAPQGIDKKEIRERANELLADFTNYEMVESSNVDFVKEGVDVVEYSNDDSVRFMIVDTVRPQFKYPKNKLWGEYVDIIG